MDKVWLDADVMIDQVSDAGTTTAPFIKRDGKLSKSSIFELLNCWKSAAFATDWFMYTLPCSRLARLPAIISFFALGTTQQARSLLATATLSTMISEVHKIKIVVRLKVQTAAKRCYHLNIAARCLLALLPVQ